MENNFGKDVIEIPEEDIEAIATKISTQTKGSPEVVALAGKLNVKEANSILEFGNEPAENVAKFADQILNTIKSNSIESSSDMIKELTSIMKKFDKNDFLEEEKKGFFAKVFKKSSDTIDKLMGKYKTIGGEIDNIYTNLSVYKKDINDTNIMLEGLYNENLEYYKQLEKYIAAGNLMIEHMQSDMLPEIERKAESSGEQMDLVYLENMKSALEMLQQRVYDLQMAKMVALQTAPQIRIIQKGNYKLVGKIHSAFIVTIPVFKNGIIQAVALKRQKLVSDSLSELDKTTNELLLKNAENIKNQSIDIAKLTSGSSVKIETLEKTWQTIMQGIEETKQIEDQNKKLREESLVKIKNMQQKMIEKSAV